MADWHRIKIEFDSPLPKETLDLLAERLVGEDYDFPTGALHDSTFFSYRAPLYGGDWIAGILREFGASGVFWLKSDSGYYESDSTCDEHVVVFREGVEPYSLRDAYRAASQAAYLKEVATRYVKIAKAFGAAPLPVVWEAITVVGYVREECRAALEAVVQNLVAAE